MDRGWWGGRHPNSGQAPAKPGAQEGGLSHVTRESECQDRKVGALLLAADPLGDRTLVKSLWPPWVTFPLAKLPHVIC